MSGRRKQKSDIPRNPADRPGTEQKVFTIPENHGIIDIQNKIDISPKQFGNKIGKHAYDFGLMPNIESDRQKMYNIINDIIQNSDEKRFGSWRGQKGEVDFHIKGNDVVVSNNGNFISILKGGINNERIKSAKKR